MRIRLEPPATGRRLRLGVAHRGITVGARFQLPGNADNGAYSVIWYDWRLCLAVARL